MFAEPGGGCLLLPGLLVVLAGVDDDVGRRRGHHLVGVGGRRRVGIICKLGRLNRDASKQKLDSRTISLHCHSVCQLGNVVKKSN